MSEPNERAVFDALDGRPDPDFAQDLLDHLLNEIATSPSHPSNETDGAPSEGTASSSEEPPTVLEIDMSKPNPQPNRPVRTWVLSIAAALIVIAGAVALLIRSDDSPVTVVTDDPKPAEIVPDDAEPDAPPDPEPQEEPNESDSVTFASLSIGQKRIIGGICQAVEDAKTGDFKWNDTWPDSAYAGESGVPAMGAAIGKVGPGHDPLEYLEKAGPVCEEIGWAPEG